jgi:outer membrane protein assembly factor BamB
VTAKSFQSYSAEITASYSGVSKSATLSVLDDSIAGFSFSPQVVLGGASTVGKVSLRHPAPAGGWKVALVNHYPQKVSVPTSVTIPAGLTSASFSANAAHFVTNYYEQVDALDSTSDFQSIVQVEDDSVVSLTVTNLEPMSGSNSVGTINLYNAAPENWTVSLVSSSPNFTVPAKVTVFKGATSANFEIKSISAAKSYRATITARDVNSTRTLSLNVQGYGLTYLAFSPSSVVGGARSTMIVTLGANAPAGGVAIKLNNPNPGALTLPTSVVVKQGDSQATVNVPTKAGTEVSYNQITASDGANGTVATLIVGTGGLATSSWPKSLGDLQNTSRSSQLGPTAPTTVTTFPNTIQIPVSDPNGAFYGMNSNFTYLDKLNALSGELDWNFYVGSTPAVGANGYLYSLCYFGGPLGFAALNSADASEIWTTSTTGNSMGPTIAPDGTVYVFDGFGWLTALNGTSGDQKWKTHTNNLVSLEEPTQTPAIGIDGTVIVATVKGGIFGIDPKVGDILWNFVDPAQAPWLQPVVGSDGTVFYRSSPYTQNSGYQYPTAITALNPAKQTKRWEVVESPNEVNVGPIIGLGLNGDLYLDLGNGTIAVWDSRSGALKATLAGTCCCVGGDGTLYVCNFGQYMVDNQLVWRDAVEALNPQSLSVKWTYVLPEITVNPAPVSMIVGPNNSLLIVTQDLNMLVR